MVVLAFFFGVFMEPIRFGSVCSGIEAASVAWHPLGWRAAWLAEIEPFPCVVLAHHYPDVPNLGDMTKLPARIRDGEVVAPDVFCGGTPCQAFSVAGLRKSLDDARGNLSLTFCEIADVIDSVRSVRGEQPATIFWENVPGVLNTKDNAFGCFLGALAGESSELQPAGGKWTNAGCVFGPTRTVAWRVLDAQYFGVAQRRRRVFVVASARTGFDPVKVLFEFDGVRRDTAPSRETGQSTAHTTAPCLTSSGRGVERTGDTRGQDPVVAVTCMAHGQDGAEIAEDRSPTPTCNHEAPIAVYPLPFDTTKITSAANRSSPKPGEPCHPLAAGGHAPTIAFPTNLSGTQCASAEDVAPSMGTKNPTAVAFGGDVVRMLQARHDSSPCADRGMDVIATAMQVRRLTPVECERLQGFPDGYTQIPWRKKPADQCPDGPRYKALGNSWAIPCVAWIGLRIESHLHALSGANTEPLEAA